MGYMPWPIKYDEWHQQVRVSVAEWSVVCGVQYVVVIFLYADRKELWDYVFIKTKEMVHFMVLEK